MRTCSDMQGTWRGEHVEGRERRVYPMRFWGQIHHETPVPADRWRQERALRPPPFGRNADVAPKI